MSNKHEATYHGVPSEVRMNDDLTRIKLTYADAMRAKTGVGTATFDAEFDRFIAKIKAEAWDEGAMASESLSCENPPCGVCEHCGTPLGNPYRREP